MVGITLDNWTSGNNRFNDVFDQATMRFFYSAHALRPQDYRLGLNPIMKWLDENLVLLHMFRQIAISPTIMLYR